MSPSVYFHLIHFQHGQLFRNGDPGGGTSADVWDALVNPATAKEYFFGAKVRSDWKEGSPITFTGEFNGNAYHEKGTILQYRPERLLQYAQSRARSSTGSRRRDGTVPW